MRPEDFLHGQRCPECAKKRRTEAKLAYSTETFKEKVNELVGSEYSVISDYIGIDKYITLRHNVCGHEYNVYPMNFIRGNRCPYCSHGHSLKTQEEFEKEVANIDPDYEVVGIYTGCQNKVLLKHKTCGTVFEIYPNNFLYKGGRCKTCALKEKSRAEEDLLEYVKSIYHGSIEENHREYSGKMFIEVDIYMKNLKLGIEFDGLYWHSVEQGKDENFHIGKTNKLAESGFKLLHIFEDEWINHKDAVKALIASYVVNSSGKLSVYKPSNEEISKFIEKYSLNEDTKYDYSLGLTDGNALKAIFLFMLGKNGRVLILKDAVCLENIGGNISGVLDKALSETKTDYVVTGADCRLYPPIDNIFIRNRFIPIKVKLPRMWYTKNGNARAKTPFKVKRQFRVWDCGKTIYKYKKI